MFIILPKGLQISFIPLIATDGGQSWIWINGQRFTGYIIAMWNTCHYSYAPEPDLSTVFSYIMFIATLRYADLQCKKRTSCFNFKLGIPIVALKFPEFEKTKREDKIWWMLPRTNSWISQSSKVIFWCCLPGRMSILQLGNVLDLMGHVFFCSVKKMLNLWQST